MSAYAKMCEWLRRNDYRFFTDEVSMGNETVDTQTYSSSGVFMRYGVTLIIRDDGYSESLVTTPLVVAEPFRTEMCELFCRIAMGLDGLGNFTMSFDDGSVVFDTVLPTSQLVRSIGKTMRTFIDVPRKILDTCAPHLVAVAFGSNSAEDAAEICIKKLTNECPDVVEDVRESDGLVVDTPLESVDSVPIATSDLKSESSSVDTFPTYSLECLNVSSGGIELETILSAVSDYLNNKRPSVDRPRMSLLITGEPGVGKTAFVRHLASRVDRMLNCLRASEMLSSHVGETEKRIRDAFETAEASGAILFIDEADSLLRMRTRDSASWEITQVNELLQLMESHNGVVICATNSDQLDPAAIRRFTFKLKLGFLTNEGKVKLFKAYFGDELSQCERDRLMKIDHLCVGDFRTVKEKLYYSNARATNQDRLSALEFEVSTKGIRPKIGF